MLVAKEAPTSNRHLLSWVDEMARMCTPDRIYWCDGSDEEAKLLTEEAISDGVFIPLNPEKQPRSYYSRSNPNDVARTEELTFVCTPTKAEAGPTNNWIDPEEARRKLAAIYDGAMKGRTMYVIPYLMGSPDSPFAMIGVELTDSIYVALNMRIMSLIGKVALDRLGASDDFNHGLHSVADCDPERRYITHFPQDNTIWSVGSGYGGNALLGKKCLALRIASYRARQAGWLAEHMMLLEAESPEGETHFIAGAFPSASGKTNLAMLVPPAEFQGWKIRTIGDDIAWMRVGDDGRLYAVNPEFGFFGVAPGTNHHTNPNAMRMLEHDCIFTNVALTPDKDVWWEGMDGPDTDLIDWRGRPWKRGAKEPAAHPNSRFTAPMDNNPALSRYAKDPRGVPISAILFGGRRSTTVPLAVESFNWTHGVYLGATAGAETTAAITGAVGRVRRDPMAMLAFIGYDAGTYFAHWLSMFGRMAQPPKIFLVNWFRKSDDGRYLWPGYGQNMRIVKWIIDRCAGRAGAMETPIGYTPRVSDLDLRGIDASPDAIAAALRVDPEEWTKELEAHADWFEKLGGTVPEALRLQRRLLLASLKATRPPNQQAVLSVPMGPFDRFNDRAKRVLALAQDEAIRFNHNYIGTEHLLLGLMREGEGVAARALSALSVDLSRLRSNVEAMIGRGDSTTSPSEITLAPQTKQVINNAIDESRKLGHGFVGTEHLLLGIVRADESTAAKILAKFGVSLEAVRHQVIVELGRPSSVAATLPSAPQSFGRFAGGGPFDRFNDRAKRVLALAQEEAVRFKHNYIGTEHLLLGLVREGESVAAKVLESLGVELTKVRTAVEFIIGAGDAANMPASPNDLTISPRTKKVIELAIDEARRLGHSHVGTEHLLLGLVREGEGIASGVIESLGVTLQKVRQQVLATLGQAKLPTNMYANTLVLSGPFDLLDDVAKHVLALAEEEARQMRHSWIGTEHLLIALLRADGIAQRALMALGVTLEHARAGVFKAVPPRETDVTEMTVTPRVKTLIGRAIGLAAPRSDRVGARHLLLALVDDPEGIGSQVLTQLGATADKVRAAIAKATQG